ncbi:YesL family protein [Enterococcus pallens]|uniref:DUF624 domain-containing protein n=1 Tax=Enterococcus pallens ATCC BAA-351 TaxID=1158607 RepID=R2SQY9_9ENTE|nr:DUF624 domain-containing protein [Enterococcus pallens]EOH97680.1 hypothetical protein UAU_00348 [Enterococcus pallens ATCC BAA-351]EOU20901.1 hypothetical protein I588_01748 [Enterococcus pallens ATCC BAA-351]OJG80220.1 hypothetical protein RV10_GL004871 [Enterococcus pallens]
MKEIFSLESSIMRTLAKVTDLFLLNVLFIVTSLPIITIGASITSLNTSWQRMLRGNDSEIVFNYLRLFKANFARSTLLWIGLVLFGGFFSLDFLLISQQDSPINYFGMLLLAPFVIAWLLLMSVVFAYQGRYEDQLLRSLKNSLLIALSTPVQALLLIILNVGAIYFSISTPERLMTAIYLYTFGGFSLLALLNSLIVKKMFQQIENRLAIG